MNPNRNHKGSTASATNHGSAAKGREDTEPKEGVRSTGLNLGILVIDDVEMVLRMLADGLTQSGQRVLTALSGEQGIELFKTNPVDVIICDLGLQDTSGWQVGRAIKDFCRENRIAKPPFIILSGWEEGVEHKDCYTRYGVDRFVTKPVDITKLLAIIRQIMTKGSTNSAAI